MDAFITGELERPHEYSGRSVFGWESAGGDAGAARVNARLARSPEYFALWVVQGEGFSMIRGRDPDAELRKLQSRFRAIAERYDRSQKFRRFLRRLSRWAATPILIGLAALNCYLLLVDFSPWPPLVTLKHLAAFPNCVAARAVGLAPATRGAPGYWPSHDGDNDGVACEAWSGDESHGERLYLPRGHFARPQR